MKTIWKILSVCAAIHFAYYGVLFIGAALGLNAAAEPPLTTQALAFIGAAMISVEVAFPALGEAKL